MTPFYLNYPKDPVKNLEWRLACGERALTDVRFRHALMDAAFEDVLWFMGAMCWAYEPRAKHKLVPFIPWCLAAGTQVVTDRGLVPIEEVDSHFLVWDGTMWVTQGGCVYKGERETISAYGIELTHDHQVLTTKGWRDASVQGFDRADVRLPDGYRERFIENWCEVALPMPVWGTDDCSRAQADRWPHSELWVLQAGEDDQAWHVQERYVPDLGEHGPALHEPACDEIRPAWRSWNQGLREVDEVCRVPCGHGSAPIWPDIRADQQRWELRTWELQVGYSPGANEQHQIKPVFCDISRDVHDGTDFQNCGSISTVDQRACKDWSSRRRPTETSSSRTKAVYDLLNCGPKQAFTVIDSNGVPLLVHNCHQCSVFVAMDAAIDEATAGEKTVDVLLDKSRAQGGTYGYLWIDLRRWLRDPMFSAGYVTRNEALVDSVTDADTLFWKLAWGISKLPTWMLPEGFDMKKHRSLSAHSLLNPANGSMLVGYSAGQDVGTGGRKTVWTVDEAGARDFVSGGKDESIQESLHDCTNHIRLVSARYVDSGIFHKACEDKDHGGIHLVLDWKDHPSQSRNSYVVRDRVPEARKPEEQGAVDDYHRKHPDLRKRLEAKGFKWEGVVRSPWYDMRCLRPTSTPRLIASQLDRDPRGAVGKAFQTELLDRMKKECCRAPIWQGTPVFDSESLSLIGLLKQDDGPLKLWFKPGPDFSAPLGPYTLGCDVAIGSDGAYSSNSVCSGIDDSTGEQVVEYTVNGVPMIKFARIVVGLGKWLRNALVGWEDSGMVAPFAKEILEILYYGNVYYRTVEAIGVKKKTKKPGWWNGKDEHKADLFEKLALGMETGKYVPRSEEMVRESGEYEWDDGKIVHQPTKNRGAREKAHGDRTIAAGVSWLVYWEGQGNNSLDNPDEEGETAEYGSFLWREQQERKRVDSDSPEFGLQDVITY